MSFLAFTGNLKSKKGTSAESRIERLSSSDEYEESDEEPAQEIFDVKKIVNHMKLLKGRVYQQANSAGPHTFNVGVMENSKFDYAFKVRWRNFKKEDDTWEPLENFNTSMTKKIRKYCKRNSIVLPEGFRDLLIPASDDGSSGSDDDTKSSHSSDRSKEKKVRSSSPQPSGSRVQVDEKKDETKRRIDQLKSDLYLSPSPSPLQPAKNKKIPFDPLFDSSGDERKKMKKEEEMEKKKVSTPMRHPPLVLKIPRIVPIDKDHPPKTFTPKGTPTVVKKVKKRDGSIDTEENAAQKTSNSNATPTVMKNTKKRDGSIDTAEKSGKKTLVKEKTENRKRKNSVLSTSDGNDSKKEEEELLKKSRAALQKRAAAVAQELKVESKQEKKPSKIDKEKQKPAGSERLSKGLAPTRDVTVDSSAATPKMSHFELEAKKKKKKLEKKMKEKGIVKKEEGDKKMDVHKKDGQKKEEKRDGKKKKKEERVEVKTEPISRGSHKRVKVEPKDEASKPPAPKLTRIEKAKKRLNIINKSMVSFARIARNKEIDQKEKWAKEEGKWRKKMYDSGRWTKMKMINDVPFSFRAEEKETDTRFVRTLRRCASAERLPVSFRRLSSLHSMKSLPSQADSLAEALLEIEIGDKAVRLRQLRQQYKEKQRKEAVQKMLAFKPTKEMLGLNELTEEFIREMQVMMNDVLPGKFSPKIIRETSLQTVKSFLTLDQAHLVQLFDNLHETPECVTRIVLSLSRIFSPILNVAEAGDEFKSICDGGQHKKCKVLLTLLMSLSEPHRMGDEESSTLLPSNTLYEVIGFSAPCQIRAMIRGGCTFDGYFDDEGKNAAHRMMEKYSMGNLIWLIERGLDVNSTIWPKKEKELKNECYDKPWKKIKEGNLKSAFISQIHSQRLTARSVAWTKRIQGVEFNIRPLTLVHTMNAFAYYTRFAAVTLCDQERKDFDRKDAVILAVHSATVRKGKGLRIAARTTKKNRTPQLRVPYFLVDPASNSTTFTNPETYECTRARLSIHNLANRSLTEKWVELMKVGSNGPTTVFRVPKEQAYTLVTGRHLTECHLNVVSPPEHSVILAQYFIVPFKSAQGKLIDS